MKTLPDIALFHHDRCRPLPAALVAAAFLVAWACPAAPALAWQNDHRAVSDGALPVEPPARRPTRREQRRSLRRGLQEPAPPTIRQPAGETRPAAVDRGREEIVVPAPALADPQLDATIGSVAASAGNRILVHRDQPYGGDGHPRHVFDLHLPDGCGGGQLPLVVWIHGPDWKSGSKADCPIAWLAGQGYAVASIEYRPSDAALFPAQLDDCRAALDDLVADASTWGIDPARVCVAGNAAGGHLAALVAFQPAAAGRIRETSTEGRGGSAAAVAVVGSPVSLTTLGPAYDRAGSPASRLVGGPLPELREAAQRASPLAHVSADDPPALIVHGVADPAVPFEQAAVLDKTLAVAGVDSTLVMLDDAATPSLAAGSPAAIALVEFLDRVIGPGIRRPQD
jgi:acetyl esterase/lipase